MFDRRRTVTIAALCTIAAALVALYVEFAREKGGVSPGANNNHVLAIDAVGPEVRNEVNKASSLATAPARVRRYPSDDVLVNQSGDSIATNQAVDRENQPPRDRVQEPSVDDDPFSLKLRSLDDATPRSVIGRPFPVSATVLSSRERCLKSDPHPENCNVVFRDLEQFSKESRSVPWATDMEFRLRSHVEKVGDLRYAVRSLECRTSLCALEVTFTHDVFFGLSYDESMSLGLKNGWVEFGFEPAPGGQRIVVMLRTYRRR